MLEQEQQEFTVSDAYNAIASKNKELKSFEISKKKIS